MEYKDHRRALVIGASGGIGRALCAALAARGIEVTGLSRRDGVDLSDPVGVEAAMARLGDLLAKEGAGSEGPRDHRIDAALMPGAATVELIEAIEAAGPFGQSAPAPRFAFPDAAILHVREVGSGHLKLTFGDGLGARLDAIAFGAFDGPLGAELSNHGGRRFHLTGRLELNHWGGRQTVQVKLDDAAAVSD